MTTEKTTPDPPFVLAKDRHGSELTLCRSEAGNYYLRIVEPTVGVDEGQDARVVVDDPAELMGNLAKFAPAVEPVALMDSDGDFHVKDTKRFGSSEARRIYNSAGVDPENHTALYAHPPVTAEPATAPSVAPNGLSLTWEGMTWVRGDVADSVSDRLTAEGKEARDKVTKLQAALDAAEAQNRAERNTVAARLAEDSARSDLARAAEEYAESKRELFAARTAAARARHAVEAETSAEAGA
ncbi:MAG TPA: hypothetical protein VIP28_14760 [Nocardioides sp.]